LADAPHKYFESVAFWQQAYERSEAAQSKLLDRIYDLEQRNETLLAKSKPIAAAEGTLEPMKRKCNGDAAGATRKRVKTVVQPGKDIAAANLPRVPFDAPRWVKDEEEGELLLCFEGFPL
jgi:hypothetical protein